MPMNCWVSHCRFKVLVIGARMKLMVQWRLVWFCCACSRSWCESFKAATHAMSLRIRFAVFYCYRIDHHRQFHLYLLALLLNSCVLSLHFYLFSRIARSFVFGLLSRDESVKITLQTAILRVAHQVLDVLERFCFFFSWYSTIFSKAFLKSSREKRFAFWIASGCLLTSLEFSIMLNTGLFVMPVSRIRHF
jgi:hypothetical protein